MSFLNPLMLVGLLAALVPIIIHLIHRRKPRRQPFAAIEFVLRSVERVERRWRLKRFLLLAARVSLLAALALAAARPLIGHTAKSLAMKSGPERLAIVIDASLSMRATYGTDRTAFARAVTHARNVVDAMGPEDQAVLVAARSKPEVLVPRPTASKNELLSILDKLEPTYEHAEIAEAVTVAARALAGPEDAASAENADGDSSAAAASRAKGRVLVLTDLSGHGIRVAADLAMGDSSRAASLELVNVSEDISAEARNNRAITEIEVQNVPGHAPRTVEARVRVRAFAAEKSPKTDAVPVDVTLRGPTGDLTPGSLDVVAGTVVDKVLLHSFEEPGYVPISVGLEPDGLPEDDVRYGLADVRREVRTLIVDGAPSGVPKEDEIFYLERALAAGAPDHPPPRVITTDDLTRADLGAYDVVVLAGVPTIQREEAAHLVTFVENGGGLWITTTEGMDLDNYNAELGRILPRAFHVMKVADGGPDIAGASGVVTLSDPNVDHAIMAVFSGDALKGLLSARTRAYALLQTTALEKREKRAPATVLVEYENGQPAIVEGEAGKGRVVILTTSIDRDLSDLPIRPGFVPLARQILLHLGQALSRPTRSATLIGHTRALPIPAGATKLEVLAPGGQTKSWDRSEWGKDAEVLYADTLTPGHYGVRVAFGGELEPAPGEGFAVNVDPAESDLRPLTIEEAAAILTGSEKGSSDEGTSRVAAIARRGFGNPDNVASWLLLFMLFAFLLESALTTQRRGH